MVASSEDPILRPDLQRWVQGKGEYLDDIRLPNLCHVAFARSPHAHARIVSIDASPAMRVPGAIDVVTPDDLSQFARAGNGGFEVGPAYGDSEVWGGLYDRPPLPMGSRSSPARPSSPALERRATPRRTWRAKS